MTLSKIFALVLIGSSSGRQLRRLSDPDPDLWLTKSDTEAGASLDNLWRSDAFSDEELDQLLDDGNGENGGNRDSMASGEEDADAEDVRDAEVGIQSIGFGFGIQSSRRRRRRRSLLFSLPRTRWGQRPDDWPRIVSIHYDNSNPNPHLTTCHCKLKEGAPDYKEDCSESGSCTCQPRHSTVYTRHFVDVGCPMDACNSMGGRNGCSRHCWKQQRDADSDCSPHGVKQLSSAYITLDECKRVALEDPHCGNDDGTDFDTKNCTILSQTRCWLQRAQTLLGN